MAKIQAASNAPVRKHTKVLALGIFIIFLVIVVCMLYPVARDNYTAYRENGRLNAEYQQVLARNDKIQSLINEMRTPEGIEDKARQEFGWVKQGEQAVNVTGITVQQSSTGLPAVVETGTTPHAETWWMQLLDFIFQVRETGGKTPVVTDVIPGL